MHGSSPVPLIVPLITADALRASIRAGELLRDVRSYGGSLTRGLRGQSCAEPLYAELLCMRGLGDLLAPVSTTREIAERARRLDMLFELLPAQPSLTDSAQSFADEQSAVPGGRKGADDVAVSAAQRGELVAADERALQTLDNKVARLLSVPSDNFSGQLQAALTLLQLEAASWRIVEHSALANRLIADHGFADTYSEARKCARSVIKTQASSGRTIPKPGDLRALRRWHQAVEVQLRALAGAGSLSPKLERLNLELTGFGQRLADWLAMARLRRAPLAGTDWKARLGGVLEAESAELLVSLQQTYAPSKANFRALIVSELA